MRSLELKSSIKIDVACIFHPLNCGSDLKMAAVCFFSSSKTSERLLRSCFDLKMVTAIVLSSKLLRRPQNGWFGVESIVSVHSLVFTASPSPEN